MIDRRYERLERRALECELNRWGKWIERHSDYEGFPGSNILVSYLMGRGGENGGHRILCLDMPVDVYAVHARVIQLPEQWQEALWVFYVCKMNEDGTICSFVERCARLGVSEEAMRQRASRARRRLLGLEDEKETCAAVMCQVESAVS